MTTLIDFDLEQLKLDLQAAQEQERLAYYLYDLVKDSSVFPADAILRRKTELNLARVQVRKAELKIQQKEYNNDTGPNPKTD